MELIYDWKSFQSLFFGKKRYLLSDSSAVMDSVIYVIVDGKVVISVLCDTDDLSDWLGTTLEQFQAEFLHRELVVFDRKKIDQWILKTEELRHYYDQTQLLKVEAKRSLAGRKLFKTHLSNLSSHIQRHFLLDATQSWWKRVLPSHYGIFIQLDAQSSSSLLIIFQNGKLVSFQVPDLSSMIPDRKKHSQDIIKYLAGRYLVPIQGLFLTSHEWAEWSESPNPWKKIAISLKNGRNKLVPMNWGIVFLILCRVYLGI
jgi:hypothetical protein